MQKIKQLGLYEKCILLVVCVTILVFAVVYPVTIAREGFAYQNEILVPNYEDENVTYSGKIQGEQVCFTVSEDRAVEFQYGDKIYGPYIAKEDPSAIPKDSELAEAMIGVELYKDKKMIFRGGAYEHSDGWWLFNEDGSVDVTSDLFETTNGSWGTIDGMEIGEIDEIDETDETEPPVSVIFELMAGPEMTHKGDWICWIQAVAVCSFLAISILFADEIFRWNLAFRIRNVEQAEPSEWEIASRYIVWTVLTIMAIALFVVGLQYPN